MSICKVSIIIAAYNTAKYIGECLDSIFNQTLKDIEVILIDDGSTDSTGRIVEQYKQRHDNLIRCYQENAGAGMARNYGITLATGEYIIFMDSDDKYPCNDCLEKLYFTAKKQKALLCGGNIISNDNGVRRSLYIAGAGDVAHTKNNFIDAKRSFFLYGHWRYLFSTKFIKDNRIAYAAYSRYEDQVFIVKALGTAGEFYELDYPVYEYRINYKPIITDVDMCYNVLCGMRDTYELIIKYDLRLMFENNYWKDMQDAAKLYIDCLFCGNSEVDRVLQDINLLVQKSGWETNEDHYITPRKVLEYRECMQRERQKVDWVLTAGKPVIIYGAGTNTRKLISAYQNKLDNVLGIAVSDLMDNSSECKGIKVDTIEQYSLYKDKAVVLITPSGKFMNDINNTLKEKGFYNSEWIDVSLL